MKVAAKDTRQKIMDASFRLFFQRGYARVSMDDIAAACGVTKRTVYYHFKSKDELTGAVLDNQNQRSMNTFKAWIDPEARTVELFINRFFNRLAAWVNQPGWTGSGFTRLTLELADLPGHPARQAASQHKSDFADWIAGELRSREDKASIQHARQLALLIEGAMTLALIHDDAKQIEIARCTAVDLLHNAKRPNSPHLQH